MYSVYELEKANTKWREQITWEPWIDALSSKETPQLSPQTYSRIQRDGLEENIHYESF